MMEIVIILRGMQIKSIQLRHIIPNPWPIGHCQWQKFHSGIIFKIIKYYPVYIQNIQKKFLLKGQGFKSVWIFKYLQLLKTVKIILSKTFVLYTLQCTSFYKKWRVGIYRMRLKQIFPLNNNTYLLKWHKTFCLQTWCVAEDESSPSPVQHYCLGKTI